MTFDWKAPARLLNRMMEVLPSCCALCGGASEEAVCAPCRTDYLVDTGLRCIRCALPLHAASTSGECGRCLKTPPRFDATVAVVSYAPPVDRLLLALKFEGRLALAPFLGRLMAERAWPRLAEDMPAMLVPVPLGPQRLRARGFNQSLEIARAVSGTLGVTMMPQGLRRVRETQAQTLLSPGDRRINLQGAFAQATGSAALFHGAHVGVIDDVMTTGETLNAVADALKALGATRVTNLVFARTA